MKKMINISEITGTPSYNEIKTNAIKTNHVDERVSQRLNNTQAHIVSMAIAKDVDCNPAFKAIYEHGRVRPSGDDVKFIVDELIQKKGLTKADIARLLGISPKGNTTLNRWLTGEKSAMPYAAWRLLCIYAGYAIDSEVFKEHARMLPR